MSDKILFSLENCTKCNQTKKLLPEDTDVLITHGPPMGIMDFTIYGDKDCGCADLRDRISELDIKAHIFGHLHYGYGHELINGVHYVNASICTEQYDPTNLPIIIDL